MNMLYRKDWKCGNCGKEYTFNEFIYLLNRTIVIEDEADPTHGISPTDPNGHGYIPTCSCGYRFVLDKWRLHDTVKIKTDNILEYKEIDIKEIDILVSTVFLELNHGYEEGKNRWYETMIFPEGFEHDETEWLDTKRLNCGYQNRYETKEEAIKCHNNILNLLKTGKYKIIKIKDYFEDKDNMELVLDDSEDKFDVLYAITKILKSSDTI